MSGFYLELKSRGVLEAATSYTIVAWLIAQVAELVGDTFAVPGWTLQALLIALAVGLPITLFLSWSFDLTPRGLIPASDNSPAQPVERTRGRVVVCALFAILALTIGALAVNDKPGVCVITPQVEVHSPLESEKS